MKCSTFKFKNKRNGETVIINQRDYNDDRYMYLTNLSSLNEWERVSETSGDEGGDDVARQNSDIAIEIKDKRKNDNLDKRNHVPIYTGV